MQMRILIGILFLFTCYTGSSQYVVRGTIQTNNSMMDTLEYLHHHPVFLLQENEIIDTTYTDHTGEYQIHLPISKNSQHIVKTAGYCDQWYTYADTVIPDNSSNISQIDFIICHHVTAESCKDDFTITEIDSLTFEFEPKSFSNSLMAYEWDFGDSTVSNEPAPVHHYSEKNIYNVNLHSQNPLGCVDTINKEIIASNESFVHGNIHIDSNYLSDAYLWLIGFDHQQNRIIKTIYPNETGEFGFWCKSYAQFLLKIIPDFETANISPRVLPTYLGETIKWQDANVLDIQHEIKELSLHALTSYFLPHGFNTIRGELIYGKNAGELPVNIYLLNENQEPIDYAPINNNEFQFTNLPAGTFYILPECAGKISQPYMVTFDEDFDSPAFSEFFVSTTQINPLGIEDAGSANFTLYPLPVREILNLTAVYPIKKVEIFDTSGRLIRSFYGNNARQMHFSTHTWEKGTYIFRVHHPSHKPESKLIVK